MASNRLTIGAEVDGTSRVVRDLDRIDRAVDGVGRGLDGVDRHADDAERALRDLQRDGDRSMRSLSSDVDRAATGVGRDLRGIGDDTDRAGRDLRDLAKDAERAAAKVDRAFDDVNVGVNMPENAGVAGAAVGGIAAAAGGFGLAAAGQATGISQVAEDIFFGLGQEAVFQAAGARTGVDPGIVQDIVQVLSEQFATLGADEIAEAFVAVKENLPTQFGTQLLDRVGNLAQLEQAGFGDVGEIARAVANVSAAFGTDPDRALDVVVTALQDGANRQGDFFDTLVEYSTRVSEIGLTLDDFVGQITAASDPEIGLFNTDKAADAIRELAIFVGEGGDDVEAALNLLDLELAAVQRQFASGQGREAFGQIVSGLSELRGTRRGQQAAVALFGTPFEDLGSDLLDVLALSEDGFGRVAGAADAAAATLEGTFTQQNLSPILRGLVQQGRYGVPNLPRDPLGIAPPRSTPQGRSDISSVVNVTVRVPQPVVNAGVVTSASTIRDLFGRFAPDIANAVGPAIAREVDRQVRRRTVFGGPQEF